MICNAIARQYIVDIYYAYNKDT